MITLTPDDIAAIADAVAARLQGQSFDHHSPTVAEEIAAVQARGGSLADHFKAKAKIGMMKNRDNKRRTKKSATTTASTETPKGARKTTDV